MINVRIVITTFTELLDTYMTVTRKCAAVDVKSIFCNWAFSL